MNMKFLTKLSLILSLTVVCTSQSVLADEAVLANDGAWQFSQGSSAIQGTRGAEVQMLTLTTSYPQGYTGKLVALLDDSGQGKVLGVRYEDSRDTKREYTVEDLRKGVSLVAGGNREMIKIVAPTFDALAGGDVFIVFNRTLMSGEDRRQVTFDYLHKSAQPLDWIAQTDDAQGRELFTAVHAKVSTTFGMLPNQIDEIILNHGTKQIRKYRTEQLPRATR